MGKGKVMNDDLVQFLSPLTPFAEEMVTLAYGHYATGVVYDR